MISNPQEFPGLTVKSIQGESYKLSYFINPILLTDIILLPDPILYTMSFRILPPPLPLNISSLPPTYSPVSPTFFSQSSPLLRLPSLPPPSYLSRPSPFFLFPLSCSPPFSVLPPCPPPYLFYEDKYCRASQREANIVQL